VVTAVLAYFLIAFKDQRELPKQPKTNRR
jgi:hypothetical protein